MGRALVIVLDGLGVGAMPDAHLFGDEGSNTLGGILKANPDLKLPNLKKLGLLNLLNEELGEVRVAGAYGRAALASPNKDTISGHWEIAGLVLAEPFLTFGTGFPDEIMESFKEVTGYGYLGNRRASGTVIIEELAKEHFKTKKPIVYTSADSVFQIAAHEEVIPLVELYRICQQVREMLVGPWQVARVIARPFKGELGALSRTSDRKDFSISPPRPTMLEYISQAGYSTCTIGKIKDIYNGRGIDKSLTTSNNQEGMAKIISCLEEGLSDFIMANLVDFDMLYGHRNDVQGFGKALEEFDEFIPQLKNKLEPEDLVIITADHGCDPSFPGTDHTREYVPLLVWGERVKENTYLASRRTLADIGASLADFFNVEGTGEGESFYQLIF